MKADANNLGASEALSRHQRKCTICRHPDREAIEEAFLHWHNPNEIACDYELSDHCVVYRHAHATGLFERRRGNLKSILERVMERAECARVTGDTVIRALRAYTCLTDSGKWVEPPTHVIFSMNRAGSAPADLPGETVTAMAWETAIDRPATVRPRLGKASAVRPTKGAESQEPTAPAADRNGPSHDSQPLIDTTVIRR